MALCAIVARGVSLSNAAHASVKQLRRPTGRWKQRLLCVSHTGCLQAESVQAWLAAHRVLESSLHAHRGTGRRFRLLVYDNETSQVVFIRKTY